jgi:CRISPR/Cas system-associated exonuclease Cas4 (RecB family)
MFKGFICEISNEKIAPDDCLTCSHRRNVKGKNHCTFTPPIIRGIIENSQPRKLRGYSVTELIGCPRRVVLKEREDYWLKPSSAYWAFRGSLTHSIIEQYHNGKSDIIEQRFYAELGGMLVTGQPDMVYGDDRHLVDYKTTKRVPKSQKRYVCPDCGSILRENQWYARKGSTLTCSDCGAEHEADTIEPTVLTPQPYDTHIQQINAYIWLLAQNDIQVDTAQVVYLDMSKPQPISIDVWPLKRTETYLRERISVMMERDAVGLPSGVWDDPDMNWRCRYCAVVEQCEASRSSTVREDLSLEEGRALLRGTPEAQEGI